MIEGNITIKAWKEQYLKHTGMSRIEFTDYATFSYDAFWVYVKALQQLMKEGKREQNFIIAVLEYT